MLDPPIAEPAWWRRRRDGTSVACWTPASRRASPRAFGCLAQDDHASRFLAVDASSGMEGNRAGSFDKVAGRSFGNETSSQNLVANSVEYFVASWNAVEVLIAANMSVHQPAGRAPQASGRYTARARALGHWASRPRVQPSWPGRRGVRVNGCAGLSDLR
jgi:hypothetical protein